jgi:flavin reductase (DIM6/NTAB) family NADH-FMN oxidoreductase RutF
MSNGVDGPAHEFRQAAGRFASGVTVVTTQADEGAYGVTVSSFASLSLNPLLVTVSINQTSPLIGYVRSRGAFAVSVLASDQQQVADYFARGGRRPEPDGFGSAAASAQHTGVPVIDGCLSWFDCDLEDVLPGGDHEILVGRVTAAGGRAGEPLVYWAGGYRALQADKRGFDRLADAADGLSVALLMLDVGVAEMLDAQRSVEPALARLAATYGTAEHWDRLDVLIAESAAAVDEPDRFNDLSQATHDLIAGAAGNRVLYATLISLRQVQSRHYRERGSPATARAAVADHRELLAALRRGSADDAGHLMQQHLEAVRRNLDA